MATKVLDYSKLPATVTLQNISPVVTDTSLFPTKFDINGLPIVNTMKNVPAALKAGVITLMPAGEDYDTATIAVTTSEELIYYVNLGHAMPTELKVTVA